MKRFYEAACFFERPVCFCFREHNSTSLSGNCRLFFWIKEEILLNKKLGVILQREEKRPQITEDRIERYRKNHNTQSSPRGYKISNVIPYNRQISKTIITNLKIICYLCWSISFWWRRCLFITIHIFRGISLFLISLSAYIWVLIIYFWYKWYNYLSSGSIYKKMQ